MNRAEIQQILQRLQDNKVITKRSFPADPPHHVSASDWDALTHELGCQFPEEYLLFLEEMLNYHTYYDFYAVGHYSPFAENGTVIEIYQMELSERDQEPAWNKNYIPFAGIGNGDVLCFNRTGNANLSVLWVDHESNEAIENYGSFSEWVKGLPDFG